MLIWINGPFGVGKTQTAHELHRRMPDSVVCDPEHLGFGLQRMLPKSLRGDFQDLASWRSGVLEVLDLVVRQHTAAVLVPMTLVEPAYVDEVLGGLRRQGHDVRHLALLAERGTVVERLQIRGLGHLVQAVTGHSALLRESFALRRLDDCLAYLSALPDDEQLWTDDQTVEQVAEAVAERSGLALGPRGGPVAGIARRWWTSARHLRLL